MDDNAVLSTVLVLAELLTSFKETNVLTEPKISEKRVVVSTKFDECDTDLSYWLLDDIMSAELDETFKGKSETKPLDSAELYIESDGTTKEDELLILTDCNTDVNELLSRYVSFILLDDIILVYSFGCKMLLFNDEKLVKYDESNISKEDVESSTSGDNTIDPVVD